MRDSDSSMRAGRITRAKPQPSSGRELWYGIAVALPWTGAAGERRPVRCQAAEDARWAYEPLAESAALEGVFRVVGNGRRGLDWMSAEAAAWRLAVQRVDHPFDLQ